MVTKFRLQYKLLGQPSYEFVDVNITLGGYIDSGLDVVTVTNLLQVGEALKPAGAELVLAEYEPEPVQISLL